MEKTLITHINDGFDLLGWNFKKYKGKLIIKSSQKSIKNFTEKLSDFIFNKGKSLEQSVLIEALNQQIRGWTNYHQTVCASTTFRHINFILYQILWRWAKRCNPKKSRYWIYKKYWKSFGTRNSVFKSNRNALINASQSYTIKTGF